MGSLNDKVALVVGGTRCAGRRIAIELGAARAHVYLTGRTTHLHRSQSGPAETIEETAELVRAAGGTATSIAADHLEPAAIAELVDRIDRDSARLDILVNDTWGGERFFESNSGLDYGLRLIRLAVDAHLITSHFALPLLTRKPGGLVVEVVEHSADYDVRNQRVCALYDLAKSVILRLVWTQGHQLAARGCAAVVLDPGHFRVTGTPSFTGRAVVALASDPDFARWSQASVSSGLLAREYAWFIDLGGSALDALALPRRAARCRKATRHGQVPTSTSRGRTQARFPDCRAYLTAPLDRQLSCHHEVPAVPGLAMRPAICHLSPSQIWVDALFVSMLQRSDEPTPCQALQAVTAVVRALGGRGCAERVAQEYGDHPETAAARMRWARAAVGEALAQPLPLPAPCAATVLTQLTGPLRSPYASR
jgi:NAD(P)-dependent dehydrogenase (short-subunit alcohol dehydrogenase family)